MAYTLSVLLFPGMKLLLVCLFCKKKTLYAQRFQQIHLKTLRFYRQYTFNLIEQSKYNEKRQNYYAHPHSLSRKFLLFKIVEKKKHIYIIL